MALWEPGSTVPSLGHHSRGMYLALLGRVVEEGRSGILEIHSAARFRRLYFVAGAPVWFESDRAQDVLPPDALADPAERLKLVKRGLALPLRWLRGGWTFEPRSALPTEVLQNMAFLDCAPLAPVWGAVLAEVRSDEILEAVTAADAGLVSPQPRLAERLAQLEIAGDLAGLADLLGRPRSVDDLLRAHMAQHEDLLKLLWAAEAMGWVRRDGDRATALGLVAPESDPFGVSHPSLDPATPLRAPEPPPADDTIDPEDQPTVIDANDTLRAAIAAHETTAPGRYVQTSVRDPALSVEPPARRHTDSGVASRSGGTPRVDRPATRPEARASGPSSFSAESVGREYASRMGTDYYTFLGVPARAGQPVIDRAWTRLMTRWTAVSKNPALATEARQQARELAQVAHLAGRTFSDPARRLEYDRRLERGQAPLAGGMKAARGLQKTNPLGQAAAPSDPLGRARALLATGDYARALPMLRSLRVADPSDPHVLAELGWAVWKSSAETDREGAEEYLQLALTFDSSHVAALERLARLAMDAGDVEATRERLARLLVEAPRSGWARSAIESLPPPGEQSASGMMRLKFWKR